MKVTAILRDFTEQFYTGFGDIKSFDAMSAADKYATIRRMNEQIRGRIPVKIETGQLRDAVELNSIVKGPHSVTCSIEPRKGYKLAVFHFAKA